MFLFDTLNEKKIKKIEKSYWLWEGIILYSQSPADEARLKKADKISKVIRNRR